MSVNQDNSVKIFGSEGWISLANPWVFDGANPEVGKIILQRHGEKQPREVDAPATGTSFTYEADVAGKAILSRKIETPLMGWSDSLGNAKALDEWRKSIGLSYEFDRRR